IDRYFVEGGKAAGKPFRAKPMPGERLSKHPAEMLIAGNCVEVFLAREGHDRPVGINYLEKIQPPTLPSLYGAMLAGVAFVLMGAGIPKAIPGILDKLAVNQPVQLQLEVRGAGAEPAPTHCDPADVPRSAGSPPSARPQFLARISSAP